MDTYGGNALFLDRSDINTDEIIPAKYLTEISKAALAPHLLEDLSLPGFTPADARKDVQAVVSRANFGCGSSREHAPWAFQVNNINLIIAENFARIFRQNMYNSGMLAIELPGILIERLFQLRAIGNGALRLVADPKNLVLTAETKGVVERFPFSINSFEQDMVLAGGWVNYANTKY